MTADQEKVIAFLPVSKIIPIDPSSQDRMEEEKKPGTKQRAEGTNASSKADIKTMAAAQACNPECDGTPNSFNTKDLALKMQDLRDDQVYYLVYIRAKNQSELNADQNVSPHNRHAVCISFILDYLFVIGHRG